MSFRRLGVSAVAIALLIGGLHGRVLAFPVDGDQTALPGKTELNEDALRRPREVFHSEIIGRRSDLVKLGNLAFSSPSILGGVAQQAGISCETCHVNVANVEFIPAQSIAWDFDRNATQALRSGFSLAVRPYCDMCFDCMT